MNHWRELHSTYSIVAYEHETGYLGAAVQTHQMGVGKSVLWLENGLGAVATQSLVNFRFGPMAITMLRQGVEPARIVEALVASDADANQRQMAVVDARGRGAAWTGDGCIREAAHHVGEGYSVQANMMTNPTVVSAMAAAFEAASGDLAQRMMMALEAAQAEGGDIRGMQSAALKVVSHDRAAPVWDTVYDLRVDEHAEPLTELRRLVRLRHAQLVDNQGYELLSNNRQQALERWAQARDEAPELEELAFWQAITLADEHHDVATAVAILEPMLAADERREHWLDLIQRLAECELMKPNTASALLDAVK